MSWTQVTDFGFPDGWSDRASADQRARDCCAELERGGILFFDKPAFDLPAADREFLLSQKQSSFKGHKNISYRPATDILRGEDSETPEAARKLREVMKNFSGQVQQFVSKFLSPYAGKYKLDFASFRPVEEKGRDLSLHKRNDLLHVDAFPTRPTNGGRILRVFANINPEQNRVWEVTDPFRAIATKYADDAGLKRFARSATSPSRAILRGLAPVLKTVGLKGAAGSPYDKFMLRFHDYLKENSEYQEKYPKTRIEFPPGSSWLVYTDTVPHAVLTGRYAMEQTFIVPVDAMVTPQDAPIRVLESMCGTALSN